jgi:hypothetical protein
MNDLVTYDMTCRTEGCIWNGVTVRGEGPEETAFMCGACSQSITDWKRV